MASANSSTAPLHSSKKKKERLGTDRGGVLTRRVPGLTLSTPTHAYGNSRTLRLPLTGKRQRDISYALLARSPPQRSGAAYTRPLAQPAGWLTRPPQQECQDPELSAPQRNPMSGIPTSPRPMGTPPPASRKRARFPSPWLMHRGDKASKERIIPRFQLPA